jgi:hypothetical protein
VAGELARGTALEDYRPDPVRRLMIPKLNGGGERALGISTVPTCPQLAKADPASAAHRLVNPPKLAWGCGRVLVALALMPCGP